jgi:hypothetical protein
VIPKQKLSGNSQAIDKTPDCPDRRELDQDEYQLPKRIT